MPFLFKQTMIFQGPGHGWTESLYLQRATDDVQAVIDFTADYRNKRAALLGAQCAIIGQRTALVEDATGNKVTRVGLPNVFPDINGAPTQPAEDTGTSLEVLFSDAQSKYKKLLFLGGAWAAIFPRANVYDPTVGTWRTRFNAWAAALTTLGFGWRRRTHFASYQISSYTFDAVSGYTTYTLTTPASVIANFGEKRTVGVEFFNRKSPLDGVQVVVPVSETPPVAPATKWTTLVRTAAPRPAQPFSTPGQMRLYGSEFVTPKPVDQNSPSGGINGVRPVGRKRGRPLLVSAGRAPARVRF